MHNRHLPESQHQRRKHDRSPVHNSLSSGNSDKILTLNLCQLLRAGSSSYSTALPSSCVRHTKLGVFPDMFGRNARVYELAGCTMASKRVATCSASSGLSMITPISVLRCI